MALALRALPVTGLRAILALTPGVTHCLRGLVHHLVFETALIPKFALSFLELETVSLL
jgi:hypothetical protein